MLGKARLNPKDKDYDPYLSKYSHLSNGEALMEVFKYLQTAEPKETSRAVVKLTDKTYKDQFMNILTKIPDIAGLERDISLNGGSKDKTEALFANSEKRINELNKLKLTEKVRQNSKIEKEWSRNGVIENYVSRQQTDFDIQFGKSSSEIYNASVNFKNATDNFTNKFNLETIITRIVKGIYRGEDQNNIMSEARKANEAANAARIVRY
jgi:hypothetical protein